MSTVIRRLPPCLPSSLLREAPRRVHSIGGKLKCILLHYMEVDEQPYIPAALLPKKATDICYIGCWFGPQNLSRRSGEQKNPWLWWKSNSDTLSFLSLLTKLSQVLLQYECKESTDLHVSLMTRANMFIYNTKCTYKECFISEIPYATTN
jgi:hypothetical protein